MAKTKLIISISFLFVSICLFSQSRIDAKIPEFERKSKSIVKATGWAYNEGIGKWFSNQNVIDTKAVPSFWRSHIYQNFTFMQMGTIVLKNEKRYVLIIERDSGYYYYEAIQEGWKDTRTKFYFVMDESSYSRIKEALIDKTGETISIRSIKEGEINNRFAVLGAEYAYNEKNLIADMIKESTYLSPAYIFELNVQSVDGKDVVRFLCPRNSYDLGDSLDKRYFEVSVLEFKKLLID